MNLHSVNTGFFKLDGGAMFGVVPKTIWNKSNPADANNLCNWALRCLLIEDGDRLVLVDTGIGNKQDAKFFSHYDLYGHQNLNDSLKSARFSKEDITDVFLTHLHFDHCGGAIIRDRDQLLPAFPNADFWSNEAHWAWATEPNDREKASFLKENILPIKESGRLKMIEPERDVSRNNSDIDSTTTSERNKKSGSDKIPESMFGKSDENSSSLALAHVSFLPDFDVRIANGHTRAMMLPQIIYKGRTIVFMADLLPSAGHLPLPYVMAYDMFPLTSLREKKSFLEEALAGDYILFFEHDPEHECCTLQKTEKGIRVKEYFQLKDI